METGQQEIINLLSKSGKEKTKPQRTVFMKRESSRVSKVGKTRRGQKRKPTQKKVYFGTIWKAGVKKAL